MISNATFRGKLPDLSFQRLAMYVQVIFSSLTWVTHNMLESTVFVGKGYLVSDGFKVAGKAPKSWRVQLRNVTDSTATLRGRKNSGQLGGMVTVLTVAEFSNNTIGCKMPQNAFQ